MRTELHIGEVAQLLGITPKTIRHYQKIGLPTEPERTPSGYRLYNAQDLLRLQRIRRLQSFGLSLKQIKSVLGSPKSEHTLRDVLQALEEELASSPSFQFVQQQVASYHADISEALWEQEAHLYALLDTFQWSPTHQDEMQKTFQLMTQYFTEHADEYQQLLVLGERFVAVASLAAHEPEVYRVCCGIRYHHGTSSRVLGKFL